VTQLFVVEDDPPLLRILTITLRARRFIVTPVPDGGTALRLAADSPPDAVVLDLDLPDLDGLTVLRRMRASHDFPVVAISGSGDVDRLVETLEAGADDFLAKPFLVDELAARLRAALRRPATADAHRAVTIGGYTVDPDSCTVTGRHGSTREVRLTATEWRLLVPLLRNPGRMVEGRQLLAEVWGAGFEHHSNYLRIHIASLRRKLEPDPAHPRYLITVPGLGYRFTP
jgi:two-component system KDP operon response regulator KdpE